MKKDDPVVHCLLTFFQNLETVGVPKREKQTYSPANVFLHKGFRVDYKHMLMHALTTIPPVEGDNSQWSPYSQAKSES